MAAIVMAVNIVKRVVMGSEEPLPHHTYKMLLIGETGSGKTSFLNLLCNCGLVQALGFTDGLAQFRNFNDIKLENARASKMESKTSDAKLYNVDLNDLKVGVIDTPGFGDSRGIKEDKLHVKRIVDSLKGEEYINCVCLTINGRQARMSATLQYVLSEVTAVLPRQVLGNVIVVFTNTSDPLDLNFDPKALNDYFGREVESERIFFIENPYCRFEKAKVQEGKLLQDRIARSLKKSFDETGEVLTEIYTVLKGFKQVHTHHFATLYDKKQEVERKVMGLLTEYDNQTRLEKQIAKAGEEADAAVATKSLNTKYRSTSTGKRMKQVPTSRHNTLCGAPGCYSNCHISCNLDKSFDKRVFLSCWCIVGENCRVCGHHYEAHFHDERRHEEEEYTTEWVDETMKKKFEDAKSMEERNKILKDDLAKKRVASEKKRKELSEQLLKTIEEFQKLGVTRNYAKLLENQLTLVNQHIEAATDTTKAEDLRKTKEELEKKLKLVQQAMKKP